MFWGLVLKANKRYSHVVSKAFHVSHATLDVNSYSGGDDDVVQVWLTTDDTNHLLCNVTKKSSHVPLDLAFSEGENIAFFSKGHGIVHLTGFLLPEDPEFGGFGDFGEEEADAEEEEESDEEVEVSKANKKGKAGKPTNNVAENGADSEDDDSDLDDLVLEDEEDDDEDDEDDDDEEDDDEEDDEEDVPAPPAKIAKLDKSAKQKQVVNGKAPKEQPKQKQEKQKQAAPQQKPQQNANQSQNQQSQNAQQKQTVKNLPGGIKIEELRVGKGPEAKAGKKVQVYYEGRLKTTNKVFDSSKGGDGFKFTLGHGEVIKGWDVGVAGMKVGSKRRITCPPNAAYGARGSPPVIPPNSTLVFDVELRGVN